MWVMNNDKERVKSYLRNDIESNRANVTDANRHVHDTIAAIQHVMDGSSIGADQKIIGDCQQAMQKLKEALNKLAVCRSYVDQLDTKEWVDDEY